MPRTRSTKAELTESWEEVDDKDDIEEKDEEERDDNDDIEEEDEEEGDDPSVDEDDGRADARKTRISRIDFASGKQAENKPARSSAEQQFVMPASPNAGANGKSGRTKTPHLRGMERSLTSDAGAFDTDRTSSRTHTQRHRLNERSLTSDAGRFAGKRTNNTQRHVEDVDEAEEELSDSSSNLPALVWGNVLLPTLGYTLDVVRLALNRAKPLLSYILLAYLLSGLFVISSNFVNYSISSALSPLCRIPGVTFFLQPSFCPARNAPAIEGVAEFDQLVQVQSAFDEVLEASTAGWILPMDMKRSEASIRDLKHVVQYSSLPSRNELVFEFNGFIDTARQASQDLSRFNSRIGRAVDHILSINKWTLSVVDGVASADAGRGSIGRFISDRLNIFAPFFPVALSQDVLLDQYLRHTSAVEGQILSLITEAQALLVILENLDSRLDIIAEISTRDGLKMQEIREELFAFLWTKVGGNRSSVKRFDKQLDLLRKVIQYKRIAWAHVTGTVVKLQAMRGDLEVLRDRVAAPETTGVERVPLQVHIESINLGIERLERQREASRSAERDKLNRILGAGEADSGRMIGEREL